MSSINENLNRLQDCLPKIRGAVQGAGGTVSPDVGYEDIAAAILNIPGQSGTITPSNIKSLTEPGTIAHTLARMADAKIDIAHAITAKGGTVNPGDGMEEFPDDIASISPFTIYGYHVNPSISDPSNAVTYVGNAVGKTPAKMGTETFDYGDWGDAFFLPKPCVLNFDGTVDYYLDPNDYSKKLDGTDANIGIENITGNVMLEFPKIWIKRVPGEVAGERTVYISDTQVDSDYKCWCNINANNEEIDHFYIHAYNGTIHNSQMRSLSGVTLSTTYAPNYTAVQEVAAAEANNPDNIPMWYTTLWCDWCLLFDLLYLIGKSLNVQLTFGRGISSGGQSTMRKYITGTLNDKGLFYGNPSASAPLKVFGIENPWCLRYSRLYGIIGDKGTIKIKSTYGTADGSTTVGYNYTGEGYLDYGAMHASDGYIEKMQADNVMGYKVIDTTSNKSGTVYYCDNYYYSKKAVYLVRVGGDADAGNKGGFYIRFDVNPTSTAYWYIGTNLSCKPIS